MTTEKPKRKYRGRFAMPAKEAKKLEKMFTALMEELAARKQPLHSWFAYTLETPLGMLGIHKLDTEYCNICMCFDNPALASDRLDCNPYSGKWNFHFPREWTAAEVIEVFHAKLTRATKAKPEYRGCKITPESSDRPIYFGVGLVGTDDAGCSQRFVRVIFPDLTWIRCANPTEARRYIDSNPAAHSEPVEAS